MTQIRTQWICLAGLIAWAAIMMPASLAAETIAKPNVLIAAFPTIAQAKLEIADVQLATAANPKATSATIIAHNLPSRRTMLKAWFTDADGKDLCGAFFVTVKRLSRNSQ